MSQVQRVVSSAVLSNSSCQTSCQGGGGGGGGGGGPDTVAGWSAPHARVETMARRSANGRELREVNALIGDNIQAPAQARQVDEAAVVRLRSIRRRSVMRRSVIRRSLSAALSTA